MVMQLNRHSVASFKFSGYETKELSVAKFENEENVIAVVVNKKPMCDPIRYVSENNHRVSSSTCNTVER